MDFARSAKYILSALIIASGLIMGSCRADTGPVHADDGADLPQSYEISFIAEGTELSRQRVREGGFANVPAVEDIEGARFVGWADENGRKAQPAAAPAQADASYTAVFFPILDGEGPYLFTDGEGLLRPDAVLETTELITALNALASDAAREYFPEITASENHVTIEELRAVLLGFYTSEELDHVILGHAGEEKLSRSQFADIMNRLLGRDPQATVEAQEGSYCVPDISPAREDFAQLMEACIAHSHSETGVQWHEIQLPAMYEEGFVLVDGSLYCADSNGLFICDTVLGSLTFGYDGRYTSGDAVLDGYVSAVISDLAENNQYTEPQELLRAAYDYCRDSFGFMRRNTYAMGARGWELGEADTMFEAGSGNGASYAAVFWALARGLGYEANAVSGVIGQNRLPHAWVEIEIDGQNYIFDPGAEAGALEDADTSRDRFMMNSQWATILKYVKE